MGPTLDYLAGNWIEFSIVGGFVVVCVRIVWRAVMPPRRMKPVKPQCEACGYALEGLESMTCPECGGDFRSVGIVTPRMEAKRRGSYGGSLVAWLVVCGILAAGARELTTFVFVESGWFSPARQRGDAQRTRATLTPRSGAYESVEVERVDLSANGGILGSLRVRLLANSGESFELVMSRQSSYSWYIRDGSGTEVANGRVYNARVIRTLFSRAGVDPSGSEIFVEVDEIIGFLNSLESLSGGVGTAARYWAGNPRTRISIVTDAPEGVIWTGSLILDRVAETFLWALPASCGLIWLAGSVWVVRKRRRLMRVMRPRSSDSEAPSVGG